MDRTTVEIYEANSSMWESKRSPRSLPAAQRFGARIVAGPAIDLGCGPGWYTAALGPRSVALDAAHAMVRRAAEVVPDALPIQGDLQALPFRFGSLGGGWAHNSYVHLAATDVPMALADLHRALRVDAPIELALFGGQGEGRDLYSDDDFPGRWFSTWSADRLRDVVLGAGFTITELDERADDRANVSFTVRATRARTLPDMVGAGMRLLVCGLNPSVHAADAGVGFVTPGNRFWPAALEAGLVSRDRDPRHALLAHGVGMTDLVKRSTPRAEALTRDEYRAGVERVDRLCTWLQPGALCVVGLAGWRSAVDRKAVAGWQPSTLGGRPVYVMPSTSGLNAATSLRDLTEHLRTASPPT